jgi:hypothetical protein
MKRIVVRLSEMPFGLASVVNWSPRCRLRQSAGNPQARTSAETARVLRIVTVSSG